MPPAVKIRNAETLTHALADHAQKLEPLVGCLAIEFVLRLVPLGWRIEQSGVGAQSYSLKKDDLQYHLRGVRDPGPKLDAIRVKDAWRNGNEVAVLRTRPDVLRFVRDRVAES